MRKFLSVLLVLCLLGATAAGCANGGSSPPPKSDVSADTNPSRETSEDLSQDAPQDQDAPQSQDASQDQDQSGEATENATANPDEAALSQNAEDAAAPGSPAATDADVAADVDLTALSSTMVYAEVFNMMMSPDDYVGRTIKMSGPYYSQYFEETEDFYHFVIIEDAAACCQQGVEFVWDGDHTFPDDYPADSSRIEVTGVFDSYEELGSTYYHLVVDDMVVL